jgi:hypothetical protein
MQNVRKFVKEYWPALITVAGAVALSCIAGYCQAEQFSAAEVEQIRQDEICRMGNCVAAAGMGIEGKDDVSYCAEAKAFTPNRDDKWFISVVGIEHCEGCKQLKHDFRTSKFLRALAHPENDKTSPYHYAEYSSKDQTQGWRFDKLGLKKFPAVIIQPPANGKYGKPGDYLPPIIGYDGNAKALARRITSLIDDRILSYRHAAIEAGAGGRNYVDENPFDADEPEPEPEPDGPLIVWPETWGEQIGMPGWLAVLWSHGEIANTIFLILGGIRLYREYRKRQGLDPLLNEGMRAKLDKLMELADKLTGVEKRG